MERVKGRREQTESGLPTSGSSCEISSKEYATAFFDDARSALPPLGASPLLPSISKIADFSLCSSMKFAVLVLFYAIASQASKLEEVELMVMQEILTAWNKPSGWEGENPCEWKGIQCEIGGTKNSLNVVSINVRNVCNIFSGDMDKLCTVPTSIGKLSHLKHLYLNGNGFQGDIPESISALKDLRSLYLNANQFTGSIPPTLGSLKMLEKLYLNDNQLTGTIPAELGNATNLRQIEMQKNDLHGNIPSDLARISGLVQLDLNDNDLDGPIPAELATLFFLHRLHLGNNMLEGAVPSNILGSDIAGLTWVDLSHNRLTGAIPLSICQMRSLAVFRADGNFLDGGAPRCEPIHGPHSDEDNRRNCRRLLRSFCIALPQVREEL